MQEVANIDIDVQDDRDGHLAEERGITPGRCEVLLLLCRMCRNKFLHTPNFRTLASHDLSPQPT